MKNLSKLLLFTFTMVVFIFLSSCSPQTITQYPHTPVPAPIPMPVPTTTPPPILAPTEELKLDLVATAPPSCQLYVEPIYTRAKICMLGSLAMLAKYDNPSIGFSDFMGCTGMCPRGFYARSKPSGFKFGDPNDRFAGMVYATRNLGYSIIVGIAKDGRIDPTHYPLPPQLINSVWKEWDAEQLKVKIKDDAKRIEYFGDVNEAFDFLKRVIASGYPSLVKINWAILANINPNLQISHHMVMNGYDERYVYLNDPGDPIKPRKLRFGIKHFKSAWSNCQETMVPANNGPLFMLFIKKSGEAKSIGDILAWNKQRARRTPSETRLLSEDFPDKIERSDRYDSVYVVIQDFAEIRSEYSKFLEKNGKKEASALYKQSSELWDGLISSSNRSGDLKKIADLEEKAQSLY